MTPVLLTRPAAQAQDFASRIAATFGARAQCILSPVLKVVPLAPDITFSEFEALVFTSQNGVAAYAKLGGPKGMVAYCVGDKTTQAAQKAGLTARSAGGDVAALNALLARDAPPGRLLHPSGVHVAGTVEGSVTRVAVYDQRPHPLTPTALAALRGTAPVLVPLFSPRTAKVLQELLPEDTKAPLHAICLSEAVSAALDPARFGHRSIATRPDAAAMMDELAEFFPL